MKLGYITMALLIGLANDFSELHTNFRAKIQTFIASFSNPDLFKMLCPL